MNNQKIKSDSGKLQLRLVPRQILTDIARIREYGLAKYGEAESWRSVEVSRYQDAAFRHFLAYLDDPKGVDEESNLPHLWHLACNIAFLCQLAHDNGDFASQDEDMTPSDSDPEPTSINYVKLIASNPSDESEYPSEEDLPFSDAPRGWKDEKVWEHFSESRMIKELERNNEKYVVRSNIFETNSSSTHAIAIGNNLDLKNVPEFLVFIARDYGWKPKFLETPKERASYLYTAILTNYQKGNPFMFEEWEKHITDVLAAHNVKVEFEDEPEDSYVDLDHAWEAIPWLEKLFDDDNLLLHFLFADDSVVITGNDNCEDDMPDMEYIKSLHPMDIFYKGN